MARNRKVKSTEDTSSGFFAPKKQDVKKRKANASRRGSSQRVKRRVEVNPPPEEIKLPEPTEEAFDDTPDLDPDKAFFPDRSKPNGGPSVGVEQPAPEPPPNVQESPFPNQQPLHTNPFQAHITQSQALNTFTMTLTGIAQKDLGFIQFMTNYLYDAGMIPHPSNHLTIQFALNFLLNNIKQDIETTLEIGADPEY